jgi:glucose/arabinose dehydrogenase
MKYLLTVLLLLACHKVAAIDLTQLSLPPGFKISYFAENIASARQMAISDTGIVYVGSMNAGNVYALQDKDNDGKAEKRWLIAKGLKRPSGIAFKDGALYVADINRIIKFVDIDNNLDKPKSEVFFSDLPDDSHHGWKFLRFAPNGELIIPVGAPCNICEAPTSKHARIFSLNMQTKTLNELAQGVRNTVGFDFHPSSGELWFSDNGGDMLGDDVPADEINRLVKPGSHFGYPYFHEGTVADPEFGKGKNSDDYIHPALKLGAHVAPLGIHFYLGKQFPAAYQQQLFVAEHGSWNRSTKSGYKIGVVTLKDSKVVKYEPFVTGFMKNETTFGRPAALVELADGSLLIADDFANVIYRVTYGE